MTEKRIDPAEHFFRHRVFEFFRLGVHFGPIEPEHLHEKQLYQPMPTKHMQCKLLADSGEARAASRLALV